jgi:hypothetical protein
MDFEAIIMQRIFLQQRTGVGDDLRSLQDQPGQIFASIAWL